MDLNKNVFSEWYKEYFGEEFEWDNTPFHQAYFLDCWQQAQKVAVPEGFVLVSMCASEETKQKMLIVFNESDGFLNCENIYKAMIEAQEQVG